MGCTSSKSIGDDGNTPAQRVPNGPEAPPQAVSVAVPPTTLSIPAGQTQATSVATQDATTPAAPAAGFGATVASTAAGAQVPTGPQLAVTPTAPIFAAQTTPNGIQHGTTTPPPPVGPTITAQALATPGVQQTTTASPVINAPALPPAPIVQPQTSNQQQSITNHAVSSTPAQQNALGRGISTDLSHKSLWDQAVDSLEGNGKSYYEALTKHLGTSGDDSNISDRLSVALEERYNSLRGCNKISETMTQRCLKRGSKMFLSTEKVVTGVAKIDPHGVAPWVFSGAYTVGKLIEGATDEQLAAIRVTVEIPELIALWTSVEKRQILRPHSSEKQEEDYRKLSEEIKKMYRAAIILLGTLMKYLHSKGRQLLGGIDSRRDEWTELRNDMKSHETNCNNIKGRIAVEKEESDKALETLKTMTSTHDTRGAFKSVLQRTRVATEFNNCCQWMTQSIEFEDWLIPGQSSVLWINGTIGTGKTTAMARAILEVQASSMIEIEGWPFAIFHFAKVRKPTDSSLDFRVSESLDVQTCLGAIARQLAWDRVTMSVRPAAQRFLDNLPTDDKNSSMEITKCVELIQAIMKKNEVYIMIDAVDECEDPRGLLRQLKILWLFANEPSNGCGPLHLMLSARSSSPVGDFFAKTDRLTISTGSKKAADDQKVFIRAKLDEEARLSDSSLFFTSDLELKEKLERILNDKAHGLFRWIEIQIDYFTRTAFLEDTDIDDQLKELKDRSLREGMELSDEYERLIGILVKSAAWSRARKMLQLVACSSWSLSVSSLAEAINNDRPAGDKKIVDKEYVRQVLVGFVSEEKFSGHSWDVRYHYDNDILELAHASVLEFLMDHSETAKAFEPVNQHTETTALCFSTIWQLGNTFPFGNYADNSVYETRPHTIPGFALYSCTEWPTHYRLALDGGDNPELITRVRDFIFSDSYPTWNRAVRDLPSAHDAPFAIKVLQAFHDPTLIMPAFILATKNLTEVLRLEEIRQTIHWDDHNNINSNLLTVCSRWANRETVACMLEGYLTNVPRDAGVDTLLRMATWRIPELFKQLNSLGIEGWAVRRTLSHMYSKCSIPLLGTNELTLEGLEWTIRTICEDFPRLTLQEYEDRIQMMKKLLRQEPYIWSPRYKRCFMIMATKQAVQELLIDYVKAQQTKGDVQRLLRQRDSIGQTPMTTAEPESHPYLQRTLQAAVARDGEELFDYGHIDIEAIRNGSVTTEELLGYMRERHAEDFLSGSTGDGRLFDAAQQYRTWHIARSQAIEDSHQAMQREIVDEASEVEIWYLTPRPPLDTIEDSEDEDFDHTPLYFQLL